MGLVEQGQMVEALVPPLDATLARLLVEEFVSMERRYIQRDWDPVALDGGQFCEILGRVLYHLDSGNLNLSKEFKDCLAYIENDQVPHLCLPRLGTKHMMHAAKVIYKFRGQRGSVHISPHYGPNELDARFLMETTRWLMAETLRVFWNSDRGAVAKAIRELLQFDVPCIGVYEDVVLVQRTDLSADEEMLVLLHYAGENGLTRLQLGKQMGFSPATVTTSMQRLSSPAFRQIVQLKSGAYRLTDLGARRLRNELAGKLLTQ